MIKVLLNRKRERKDVSLKESTNTQEVTPKIIYKQSISYNPLTARDYFSRKI